jgi:nucleotide-binding universal stress UspA family protein
LRWRKGRARDRAMIARPADGPAAGPCRAGLGETNMYRKILVPLDGSATAEAGLREAIALAAALRARLCLLNVFVDLPLLAEVSAAVISQEVHARLQQHGRELLAKAEDAAKEGGAEAESVLHESADGSVADAIVSEAARLGCDLIVMGTHGRRGLRRLTLGSDAEQVVRHSVVPVVLVRRDEAATA